MGGVERYARDLSAFGGLHEAIDALVARAAGVVQGTEGVEGADLGARRTRANLLIEAANMATEQGLPERALHAAARAIESDPSRADAVPLVEKNAHVEGGIAVLDRAYDLLAGAALGCFGRRSAHYRAARQLERRGALDLALRHAAACFEAIPSEGTSYVLLTRLAERTGDPGEAVRALERVADAGEPRTRPLWWKRAASLAGGGEDGLRTRFDLLLRALIARPDSATVAEVAAAARALAASGGDAGEATDMVRLRVERAVKASLRRLDGPDGARAAVSMARLAVTMGASPTPKGERPGPVEASAEALAFAALDRAIEADGDIDEYEAIEAMIPELTAGRAGAEAWLARLRATAEKPYSNMGKALLRMASRVAQALGDTAARAALLVTAVKRDAEDDALVAEADLAVSEHDDPALAAKLDAAAPPDARARAHLRLAEERERQGRDSEAIAALTRVRGAPDLDVEVRGRATAQLQRLLGRSGRDEDAEVFLRGELGRRSLPPPAHRRVAHDLADLLLRRDDRRGAFSVLASLESEGGPPDPDLLGELRGLARATDDLPRYAAVLADAAKRATDDDGGAIRLEILRELGPLHAELGEVEQAAACYEEIARLDPADVQAIERLERAANERGDHHAIAALLGRRIALSPAGDKKRMLRLRRAAVLEQRLGLLDEAAEELGALLVEAPHDVSALRFLADIHERRGALFDAAELLERLEATSTTSEEKAEYGLRAAAAYLGDGKAELAERSLSAVAHLAQPESILELRVEIARAIGDGRALADALDNLAASGEPPERRAALLLEAARASAALGDDAAALDRARRALKLAPHLPDAVLEARRLEYRGGGAGAPREAQAAVDELNRIEPRLAPEQIELHAFLLAEELDVIQGGGAGMRELSRRHAEVGPLPLIALGMAERMVRGKSFDAALPLFDQALAGDLRGMRARGRVALAAAEAAFNAQAFTSATRLLGIAEAEPDTRVLAERKQLELAAAIGDRGIARSALEDLLRHATGLDRARFLLQLGRLLAEENPERAAQLLAEAGPLSTADRSLPTQIADAVALVEEHLDELRRAPEEAPAAPPRPAIAFTPEPLPEEPPEPPPPVFEPRPLVQTGPRMVARLAPPSPLVSRPSSSVPPPLPAPAARAPVTSAPEISFEPVSMEPEAAPEPVAAEPDAAPEPVAEPEAAPEPVAEHEAAPEPLAPEPEPPPLAAIHAPAAADGDEPPPSPTSGETDEQRLLHQLGKGSFEAGEQLIARYGTRPGDRSPDVLAVRRQQAMIRLGDRATLQRLVEAAVLDGNPTYARAIEHVLHVWDADSAGPQPPALSAQRLAPDLVAALLFRPVADSAVHEALALVLDTGLYRRDVGQYQLTGVARVQPTGGSVLGEVFGMVARYLGQARTALFYQRSPASPSFKIALLSPPAIVLSGDIRDETPELRYLLGAALTGAMPEHTLVNALGDEGLHTLIDALHAAFGPFANLPRGNAAVARLGQNLWQLVPPRADRRLRELCSDLSAITYEAAVSGTRQAMRRSGLFASGNLGTALAQIALEVGVPTADVLGAPDGLARACADHPEVADIVRLAIRTELAEARWAPGTPQERRRTEGGPRSQRWDGK